MELSIIIPVYNVEKYIKSCLDSIISQTGFGVHFEVIIVNDGSPDNCEDILSEYKSLYPQLLIINQSNQGLSSARNKGLEFAKGKYTWFIDSDDTIVENCMDSILEHLKDDVDILQLNYRYTYENRENPLEIYHANSWNGIKNGKEVLILGGLPSPAQFSIYKRKFILDNSLRFLPGILHEDSEFKPRVTYLAESIAWHKPFVYNYLQRSSGNIMSTFSIRNARDIIIGIKSLHNFLEDTIKENRCKRAFRSFIALNFNNILYGMKTLNDNEKGNVFKLIKDNIFIFKDMIRSNKIKYIFEGLLFNINISIGLKIYSYFK